jgi:hypothetical protein
MQFSASGTYGEVLWDVLLDETDVSCVTGASSFLVSLVLVTGIDVSKVGSSCESAGRREGGCKSNDGQEDDSDFGEHLYNCLCGMIVYDRRYRHYHSLGVADSYVRIFQFLIAVSGWK